MFYLSPSLPHNKTQLVKICGIWNLAQYFDLAKDGVSSYLNLQSDGEIVYLNHGLILTQNAVRMN